MLSKTWGCLDEVLDQHKASGLRDSLGVKGRGGWGRQGGHCGCRGGLETGGFSVCISWLDPITHPAACDLAS